MIYLVTGSTGHYSDREEWNVCYYKTEAKAVDLAKKLASLCDKLYAVGYRSWWTEPDYTECEEESGLDVQAIVDELRQLDPRFHMDYTGTCYWSEEVVKGD